MFCKSKLMKHFIAFLSLVFIVSVGNAQVKISGTIKDNKGNAIIGASISIKNSYDGATSDSSGLYAFKTTEKGVQVIVFSSIGFKEIEQPIIIANAALSISIAMKEKLDELRAVSVTAGSFEASDKKKAATVLNMIDVVTVVGANADITSAVKTLPGAQQVGEQEGLFVRGGAGYETKQIIDGTVVNNPFFSSTPDIASRGRFSPFLFKGTVFSTGGYSALYGQALSSVLLLESIDLPEQSQTSASISPLFLGAGYQSLAKDKKSSWGINYGYTNLVAYFKVVKQKPDYFTTPEFHNGDANFRIKTKNGGMVKYYTSYGTGRLGLRRPDIDSTTLKDVFALTNSNWYAWFITPVALIIHFYFIAIDRKTEKVKTYISQANSYLWMAIGFSFLVLAFIFSRIGWQYSFPFYILFYGMGTSVSGALLQFRPMVLGGASCFVLAAVAAYIPYDLQILLTAFAILISYIIPGHLLRARHRHSAQRLLKQA